jgi:Tfp pilus assembly protein PilX
MRPIARHSQQGIVLFIALVALLALSLAGLALMRSVSSGVLVAGNLGFKRATLAASGHAVEAARRWIVLNTGALNNDQVAAGYWSTWGDGRNGATGSGGNPGQIDGSLPLAPSGGGWSPAATVPSGGWLSYRYVIHRMCNPTLGTGQAPNPASCLGTTSTGSAGSSQGGTSYGRPQIILTTDQAYFRITVAIQGPRNSVSYVQAMVQ